MTLWGKEVYGNFLLSIQLCCEPKIALKKSIENKKVERERHMNRNSTSSSIKPCCGSKLSWKTQRQPGEDGRIET